MSQLQDSSIRQSDPDSDLDSDSNSNSDLGSLDDQGNAQFEDEYIATEEQTNLEPKVPLSTSIVLDKLPQDRQSQLNHNPYLKSEQKSQSREGTKFRMETVLPKKTTEKNENQHSSASTTKSPEKVTIRFQPIGSTTAIHPKVFKISSMQSILTVNKFLSQKLKNNERQPLHLYIQNSFLPSPDERVGDLYALFATNHELIISYCNTIAFG